MGRTLYNNILKESVSEIASDYETFDAFKKGIGNPRNNSFFVYSQVDKKSIPNICLNGTDGAKEWMKVMYYGRGIYTVLSYNDCANYGRSDAMVKYAVKRGAFNNFLIFDIGVKEFLQEHGVLTLHEKISDTVKRLFSQDDVRMFEQHYGNDLVELDRQVVSCKNSSSSWNVEERFWEIAKTGEGMMQLRPGFKYHSEKRLDVSNVDGFAYYSSYGMTAIFRTTDLLIPYSYFVKQNRYDKWPSSDDQFKYCLENEDNFNNANYVVDAFRRERANYPDTEFTEKTISGFSLVRNGNKYNLLSSRTNKVISPLDFDFCIGFDPFSNTTTCGINTKEDGTIEFKIESINYGKNLKIQYRQVLNDEKSPWESISYSDFIDVMNEFKAEQNSLNESVEEVFTHKDFNTFKKYINNPKTNVVFLYRASDPKVAKSEYENGPNYEFTGTGGDDSLYYGFGVYTCRDEKSILGGKYGRGICKFVLKDGYKDFIILDDETRAKFDPGATVYDELKRLVPKDILDDIDRKLKSGILGTHLPNLNSYKTQDALRKNGIEAYKNINIDPLWGKVNVFNTASFARALKLVLQGRNLHDNLARHAYDELLMAKTKIRGFVYNGGSDGKCALVRDFNSLMPVAYSEDGGMTWKSDDSNEERFNRINQAVHPWYQYRGEYEDIGLRDKPSGNFSLVKGKQGYNWKDIWFHRNLLPIDADSATNFDPFSGKAEFSLGEYQFAIISDNDMNCRLLFKDDDGWEDIPYDDFIQAVQMMQEQNIIDKTKQINNNCLLNPAIKRNK